MFKITGTNNELGSVDIELIWGSYEHRTMVENNYITRLSMAAVYGLNQDEVDRFFDALQYNTTLTCEFNTDMEDDNDDPEQV